MSRPRRGTPEGEIAHAKWKKTMLEKYGADGLHAMMKRIGAKGGRNGHTGGFASDRQLAKIAGTKGGMISKRSEAKNWFDKNETTIARMLGDGASYEEIARKLNVDSHRVYYCVKKYGAEYETI